MDRNNLIDDSHSDKTLTGNNWKAGLVFALTPETSFYGQVATSTDGIGGPDFLEPEPATIRPLDRTPDRGRHETVVLGSARRVHPGGLSHRRKKLLADDPGNPTLKQQVGQQSSNGLEASLDLQLPHAWQLQANAAM